MSDGGFGTNCRRRSNTDDSRPAAGEVNNAGEQGEEMGMGGEEDVDAEHGGDGTRTAAAGERGVDWTVSATLGGGNGDGTEVAELFLTTLLAGRSFLLALPTSFFPTAAAGEVSKQKGVPSAECRRCVVQPRMCLVFSSIEAPVKTRRMSSDSILEVPIQTESSCEKDEVASPARCLPNGTNTHGKD